MKGLVIFLRYWAIRFFFIAFISLIVFGCYFFSVREVSLLSEQLINPYYFQMEDLPTWLYGVEYLILTFIASSILFVFLIIIYKRYKIRRSITRKKFNDFFALSLSDYLYSAHLYTEEEKIAKIKVFRKMMTNDYSRRLFINTLRKALALTTGPIHDLTVRIFYAFRLESFISVYLHGPYLKKKLFALRVISDFQMQGYDKYIIKLAKHQRHETLHAEALVTLINLSDKDNLLFLIDNKIILSLWDIDMIIKTLELTKKHYIHFNALIQSDDPGISTLGIILTRIHKRINLKDSVRQKIGNRNTIVNEEAILSFTTFAEDQSDYDILIESYGKATEKSQRAIVNAMKNCPDKDITIQFLQEVIENGTLNLKVAAVTLLLDIDFGLIINYKNSENPLIRRVCMQVLDFNL